MGEQTEQKGILYLVPTPIGHLDDMTFRAVQTLKDVDVIAAEDTRVTMKLCRHFDIPTPLMSYHEHNKERQGKRIIEELLAKKKIALVSDAGTPAISDPGSELVTACLENEIKVVPLPGANAAITALIASGLFSDHFYFYGFLPRSKKEKRQQLDELLEVSVPIIFYEAPHRLKDTLQLLNDKFGKRNAVLARELTKRFEEFIRGTIDELYEWTTTHDIRGEFCIVVEGNDEEQVREENIWWSQLSVMEHVKHYINNKNVRANDAIKQVAKERGLSRRDVYHTYHIDHK